MFISNIHVAHLFLNSSRWLVTRIFEGLSSTELPPSNSRPSLILISFRICSLYWSAILLSGDSFKASCIYLRPSEKLFYLHGILQDSLTHILGQYKSLNSSSGNFWRGSNVREPRRGCWPLGIWALRRSVYQPTVFLGTIELCFIA